MYRHITILSDKAVADAMQQKEQKEETQVTRHGNTAIILEILVAVSILMPAYNSAAQTPPTKAKDIIEKMQAVYAAANDYQATFVQTTAHKLFAGRLERSYGIVKFKKGGLMRWEYQRPENKLFIYDGKTLWVYEPEVPQVFAGTADAERLQRALAFLTGEGKILNEYSVKMLDAKKFRFEKGVVLGLTPKDKRSPYKRIELYIDTNTYRVARSVVVDHEKNRNRLDFTNPKTNTGIPASAFAFTPPKGVPVLSPNQQ
jgi:outer membrane lipoprotein carrier protein